MGYIYEAMDWARESIAKSFNQNKEMNDEVFKIIDKRWDVQLHRPLHATGFYLNPEFFYKDPEACKVPEVIGGLYNFITKLIPNNDTRSGLCRLYEKAERLFGNPMTEAKRYKGTRLNTYRKKGKPTPKALRGKTSLIDEENEEEEWETDDEEKKM
ncbi:hypothetical protein RHMOL_Rhmol07G0194500 [Rhododendron molle]|uniref:Uncharacterized protein n=1 Tax=Rhododendron molle TaxID=49168 RepID=A0ACC0N2S2_RHOML|nr:hypothetical protein RHMOL_Rhmol07G0194500 [Rhododendron molle]